MKLQRKNSTGQFKKDGFVEYKNIIHKVLKVSTRGHMYQTKCMKEMQWVGLFIQQVNTTHKLCPDCFGSVDG